MHIDVNLTNEKKKNIHFTIPIQDVWFNNDCVFTVCMYISLGKISDFYYTFVD